MDIVSRLKSFIDYLGLTYSTFADHAGITRPTLSQILNGRNKKISNELINKIHDAFPSLNIMWLMFGDGSMIVGKDDSSLNNNHHDPQTDNLEYNHISNDVEKPHEIDINLFDLDEQPSRRVKNAHTPPTPNYNHITNQGFSSSNHTDHSTQDNTAKKSGYPAVVDEMSFWDDITAKHTESDKRPSAIVSETCKEVSYIMVFYTDNSYEVFKPQHK